MIDVNTDTCFTWKRPLDINGIPMTGVRDKQGTAFYKLGDKDGAKHRQRLRPMSHRTLKNARRAYRDRVVTPLPPYWIIEPVGGICNRRCPFCSISVTNRKGMMQWADFMRLMEQTGAYHGTYGLSLYQLGEPFFWHSEPGLEIFDIADMVRDAKAIGGFKVVNLSTNGDVSNLSRALDCPLDDLIISIDGTNRNTYKRNRPAVTWRSAYDQTVNRVKEFLREKIERKSTIPYVRMQIINKEDTRAEVLDYIRMWLAEPGVDEVYVKSLDAMAPWVGTKAVGRKEANKKMCVVKDMPCQHLWSIGSMTCDGIYNACCHDARTQLTDGSNVNSISARNWWNGEYMTEIRRKHAAGELEAPCSKCHERDCWLG